MTRSFNTGISIDENDEIEVFNVIEKDMDVRITNNQLLKVAQGILDELKNNGY